MSVYDIRKEMMLAKYQLGLFTRELKRQQKLFDRWEATKWERADNAGITYKNYDDIYNDYIVGAIDEHTYWKQKQLYNLIIADNRQRHEKLEWLKTNVERYGRKFETLERLYKEAKRKDQKKRTYKHRRKVNGYKRRTYDVTKRISKYNQPKIKKG